MPENTQIAPLDVPICSALERLRLSQTARPMEVFAHWKREGYPAIVDALTGIAWDEEGAGQIKSYCSGDLTGVNFEV
jgi:hypothetical protein